MRTGRFAPARFPFAAFRAGAAFAFVRRATTGAPGSRDTFDEPAAIALATGFSRFDVSGTDAFRGLAGAVITACFPRAALAVPRAPRRPTFFVATRPRLLSGAMRLREIRFVNLTE